MFVAIFMRALLDPEHLELASFHPTDDIVAESALADWSAAAFALRRSPD